MNGIGNRMVQNGKGYPAVCVAGIEKVSVIFRAYTHFSFAVTVFGRKQNVWIIDPGDVFFYNISYLETIVNR